MDYSQEINSTPVVLVEFFASWCPHCQRMMPVVAEAKERLAGKVKVLQFDIDKNQELAQQEKVEYLPTFLLYDNGKEVMRQTGEMPLETLLEKIQAAVK